MAQFVMAEQRFAVEKWTCFIYSLRTIALSLNKRYLWGLYIFFVSCYHETLVGTELRHTKTQEYIQLTHSVKGGSRNFTYGFERPRKAVLNSPLRRSSERPSVIKMLVPWKRAVSPQHRKFCFFFRKSENRISTRKSRLKFSWSSSVFNQYWYYTFKYITSILFCIRFQSFPQSYLNIRRFFVI